MTREVFNNKKVAYFFNANYISVKIDAEKGEGIALSKKYAVSAFPTLVFLNKEGELINKLSGAVGAERLIYEAKKSLSPDIKKLNQMIKVYESGKMNLGQKIDYLEQLKKVKMDCSDVFNDFLKSIPKNKFMSRQTIFMMYKYCKSANDKNFDLLLNNYKDFAKLQGRAGFDKWIFWKSLFQCYTNRKTNTDNSIILSKLKKAGYPYASYVKETYEIVIKSHDPNYTDEIIERSDKLMRSYTGAFSMLMNELVKSAYNNEKLNKFVDKKIEWISKINPKDAQKACAKLGCLFCLNKRDYKNGLKYFTLAQKFCNNKDLYKDNIHNCKKELGLLQCETYGQQFPIFKLKDINGNTVSLSDFKGKYVLLDFWASWCGPCKGEIPYLKQAYKKYNKNDLVIMSISCDKSFKMWEQAITKEKMGWIQVNDPMSIVFDQNKIKGIPRIILLNKKGNIIADELRGQAIERELNKVIN